MRWIVAAAVLALALVLYLGWSSCDREPDLAGLAPADSQAPIETEAVPPQAPPGPDGRLVDVGGHRLHIRTFGTGSPAIVIETGLGNDVIRVWEDVIDALSDETQVVFYTRAAYGASEPGPFPRTSERIAGELHALVDATPIEPPFIVVGHSIGAINALVYASEHKNVVDGLVLLDPPPLDFIRGRRFPELVAMGDSMTAGFRLDAERARDEGDERQATYLETVASEHDEMFRSSGTRVATIESLGAMPLVVVVSGVPNPQFEPHAEEFQRFWRDSGEELTRLSTRGEFVFASHSDHDLPGNATDTVVRAIRRCIAMTQEPSEMEYWEGEK
jgi:pimeloyl-ACP methyl ester carboxylesterase